MKLFIKSTLAGIILCSGFVFTPLVHAEGWMGHGDGDRGQMRAKMEEKIQQIYDQLGLSDEQKKLLEDNKAKHKASSEIFEKDMRSTMQAMGEELKKTELDMNQISVLRAKLKALRDQKADERFDAILEVRKILTKEQFAKFSDLMEQQRGMHSKE